jgi:plasmid stability protein
MVFYRNRMGTVMASITLKNIPEALHQNLREQAARHHRSIHGEILAILEAYVRPPQKSAEQILAEIQELHARMPNVWAAAEDIDRYKKEGRK